MTTVREVMTTNVTCVDADASLADAAALMAGHRVGRLLVCSGDEVVGIVCRVDLAVGMEAGKFGQIMQRLFTEPEGGSVPALTSERGAFSGSPGEACGGR